MSNWKEVISFTFPSQAHMVQGFLESEGIKTMLKDELTAQVNTMYSNAVGGVKVMVFDDTYEEAIALLKKGGYINPEKVSKIEVIHRNATNNIRKCPFCRSENIGKKKLHDVIMLIASMIIGVIFPMFRRTYICFDCGKEWIYGRKN